MRPVCPKCHGTYITQRIGTKRYLVTTVVRNVGVAARDEAEPRRGKDPHKDPFVCESCFWHGDFDSLLYHSTGFQHLAKDSSGPFKFDDTYPNKSRAASALRAIKAMGANRVDPYDPKSNVADLIANLAHYCDKNRIHFADALYSANESWEIERKERCK